MNFLIIARERTDNEALVRRLVVRERHLAAARHSVESGNMLIGGAILDDEGRTVGSMSVVSFPDRDAFDEWLQNVPYMKNNIWKEVEVYPYHVAITSWPGLEDDEGVVRPEMVANRNHKKREQNSWRKK